VVILSGIVRFQKDKGGKAFHSLHRLNSFSCSDPLMSGGCGILDNTQIMNNRIIAIGDIHGCSKALAALIELIKPKSGDTIVTLGDYVDRGPDTKGVLDQLIELGKRCHLVPLMGNHEEMMLGAREGRSDFDFWMQFGGDVALESYGLDRNLKNIPYEHWAFLKRLPLYYETEQHFFVHANYYQNRPLNEQDGHTLLWMPLDEYFPPWHHCGKIAVLGHTPQPKGKILNLDHMKCIDTGCGHGGLLTALNVKTNRFWQVDENGQRR
jgi:serine/threonine protein phosphatase 1